MNAAGSDHLLLNARVLYHNFLNVEPNADFPRCFAALRAFDQGSDSIMAMARQNNQPRFSLSEIKTILTLSYSEIIEGPHKEKANTTQKTLNEKLGQLESLSQR